MKITSVSVGAQLEGAFHGGVSVGFSGVLLPGENFEQNDADQIGASISAAVQSFRETALAAVTNTERPTERTTGRSRRGQSAQSAEATTGSSEPAPATSETSASSAEPTTTRRRRGSSTSAQPAEPAQQDTPDENPTGRRRRGAAQPAGAETTNDASAPPPARRRGPANAEAKPGASATSAATTSPSDDKITDADLSKACSEAAEEIGPKEVLAIIAKHGAGKANEIEAKDRRNFLDALDLAVATA